MNDLLNIFFSADFSAQPLNVPALLLGLCLAFLCGLVIAWVYMATHAGLSYSRAFVNSLVVIPMIVTVVMMVLNNNLVTAFGLMAVFAVVRFRNILRDTLDTTYVLSSLVIGMAAGTQKFASAVVGCAFISATMIYLWYTSYGSRQRYDLVLNLHWDRAPGDLPELDRLLRRHAWKLMLASQRAGDGETGADLCYRLLLRNAGRTGDLLTDLREMNGVSHVTTMAAEDESEI